MIQHDGLHYLVEMAGADPVTGQPVNLYFSTHGFNTLPTDTPPNRHYAPRVRVPGNYERTLFSSGSTSGRVTVGGGLIELTNNDGALDHLRGLAFCGYPLRILAMPAAAPVYAHAEVVFLGTVEQLEMSWDMVKIRLRDRLAELAKPLQEVTFKGTTTRGGLPEAEGKPDDLKDARKPTCWGAPAQIEPVQSNAYDLIYDMGQNGLSAVTEVRDKGVALTAGADHASVAALAAASVARGAFATCRAAGLIKLGSVPAGQITAAPVEGATAAERTAAQVARRMLLRRRLVEGRDFLERDIAALDAANAAPVGYWTGTDAVDTLDAVTAVLGSIGATICPDRLGVMRMLRFGAPTSPPKLSLTADDVLETQGRGLQIQATGDEGRGVPAWKVTIKYRRNQAVMSGAELETAAPADWKTFIREEWRQAVASSQTVRDIYRLAPELTYETCLINEADARTEAARLLALHSVPRDRYLVPVKSSRAAGLDLGDTVRLRLSRFGLSQGRDFTLIGLTENYETGLSTLDIWG